VGFFITPKVFLTNGTCMALLLLAPLIKKIVFLTRGVFFVRVYWMIYLTYGQISHHSQIEWLKNTHVFQGLDL
jgi:hypothetical protein